MKSNKTIWMCWFQGEGHEQMPGLNRECISRWRYYNPGMEVNVLSDETISDYVPEYYDIIKDSPERSWAAKSDLLRILLLSKFGGVWVDASVYPMLPLSEFYNKIVNETGFFSYRFIPRGSFRPKQGLCETVSWFLCVETPVHYIIEKWKYNFIEVFKSNVPWLYYNFHQTLTDLYDADSKAKYIIDNMVQISEKIPHSGTKKIGSWVNRRESYLYKRPEYPKCLNE
jgi:hypothetical protein